jgi:adenosylcobinamide-phosphate synthase
MRPRLSRRALAAAAGVVVDLAWGEPGVDPHPVSAFGRLMTWVEGWLYRDRRAEGVAHMAIGVAVGAGAGAVARSTAAGTYLSVAPHALAAAARGVEDALAAGDLERARKLLPALVGRDPSGLEESEIARAVIESVAENTVDAVVAPVMWALTGGAVGTLAYRAANTMDAMVGHRNERYARYGWASARLDDIANYIPARLTALLVVLVRPAVARAVWAAVRRDAPGHPSPNAGVAEAAFAAALGLRLGGANTYGALVEQRVFLGQGRTPASSDIATAVTLSRDVTRALVAGLLIVGIWGAMARSARTDRMHWNEG